MASEGGSGFSANMAYGHPRMPMSKRAKIFQPFDPLKGFDEALRHVEREAELAALEGDGVSGVHGPYEPEDGGDVPGRLPEDGC